MKIDCQRNNRVAVISLLAAFTACSVLGQSNTIPFADSFEQMTNNTSIIDINYWVAPTSTCAIITNSPSGYTYTNALRPLRYATHTNFVVLNTENYAVSNLVGNPAGVVNTKVFVDTMVKFQPWSADAPSSLITNDNKVQAAVFLDTNKNLVIFHSERPSAGLYLNRFSTNTDITYESNDWHRLTINMDYSTAGQPKFFKIQVDGATPITNAFAFTNMNAAGGSGSGGVWFLCANVQAIPKYMSSVSFSGVGLIDDFVVTNVQPQYGWLISATNLAPMGISFQPLGNFEVRDGTVVTFTNSAASNLWTATGIYSDGVVVAFAPEFAFPPANTDHTYSVKLTPDTVTNNTPKWWLVAYLTNGTTRTNDVDAMGDDDSDGLLNWQEWLASTDPTNANSKFQITGHYTLGGTTYVKWVSPCIDPLLPPFEVKRSTNLTTGVFVMVDGNITRARTNIWAELNPPGMPAFYKILATNSF